MTSVNGALDVNSALPERRFSAECAPAHRVALSRKSLTSANFAILVR